MKKHNPHTPIMIREALGVEPKVYARYGVWTERYLGCPTGVWMEAN
jgi:NADH dehydrogenase (ubiquinone) 1 alpha subcomplex subunit 2